MFAKETYTTRRNSLKKRGDRFLAILDNEESGDYADNTYHFRQGSTSLYFWDLPYAGLAIHSLKSVLGRNKRIVGPFMENR